MTLVYYVNLLLNMFRMLVHPSSGAYDYFVRYSVGCIVLYHYSLHYNAPSSLKLLKMDVLASEIC